MLSSCEYDMNPIQFDDMHISYPNKVYDDLVDEEKKYLCTHIVDMSIKLNFHNKLSYD